MRPLPFLLIVVFVLGCISQPEAPSQEPLAPPPEGDTTPPRWYGSVSMPPAPVYSPDSVHQLSIFWKDDVNVSEVILQFDDTNYSYLNGQLSRGRDTFSIILTGLSGGTHRYKWYASDTSNNWASSDEFSYSVAKAQNFLNLDINGLRNQNVTIEQGEASNVIGIGGGEMFLFRDDKQVASGTRGAAEATVLGPGFYEYKVNSTGDKNHLENSTGATFYLRVLPVEPPREFIFDVVYTGFNTSLHMPKIKEMGITNLTVFICWGQVETSEDVYDWAIPDMRIGNNTALGMPPAGVVIDFWECKPGWLVPYNPENPLAYNCSDPQFINELAEFAHDASARYGDKIKYWMIGNEMSGLHWEGRNATECVTLYKNVSRAVKRGNPNVKVGTRLAFDYDTLWGNVSTNWEQFLDAIKDDSDWIGLQTYPAGGGHNWTDDELKKQIEMVRERSGGLPIWITETGAPTCACLRMGAPGNHYSECTKGIENCDLWINQTVQALLIKKYVRDALEAGVFGISIYRYGAATHGHNLIDEKSYWEDGWLFVPKEGYFAYKEVIAEMKEKYNLKWR